MFISCLVDKQTANIYTMEHYSAIKRNELLVHAIAWIIPSKISQTQKATPSCKIPFIWHSRKGTTRGTEIRSLVARGWEGDKRTKKKHKELFGVIKILCILIVVMVVVMSLHSRKLIGLYT